jgi:hypothetical protein
MSLDKEISGICSSLEHNIAPELQKMLQQLSRYGKLPKEASRKLYRSIGRTRRHMKKLAQMVIDSSDLQITFEAKSRRRTSSASYGSPETFQGVDVMMGGHFVGFMGQNWRDRGYHYFWELTPAKNIGVKSKSVKIRGVDLAQAQKNLKERLHNQSVGTLFTD